MRFYMLPLSLSSSSSSSTGSSSASSPSPKAVTGPSLTNLSEDVWHRILGYLDPKSIGALACASKRLYSVIIPVVNQGKPIEVKQFIENLISKLRENHSKNPKFSQQIESLEKILSSIIKEIQQRGYQAEQTCSSETDDETDTFFQGEEADPIDQPPELSSIRLEQLIDPSDLPLSQFRDKMLILKDQIINVLATLSPSVLKNLHQIVPPTAFENIFRVSEIMASINPEHDYRIAEKCKDLAEEKEFERALKIANTPSRKPYQGESLANIVLVLIRNEKMNRAIEIANTISDEERRAWALKSIAEAFIDKREFDRAIEIAKMFPNEDKRNEFLEMKIIRALRDNKDFDRALAVIDDITKEQAKNDSRKMIAVALAKNGDCERALNVAQPFLNDPASEISKINQTFEILIEALIKNRNFDRALEVINSIGDNNRFFDLNNVADALIKNGNFEEASMFFIKIQSMISSEDFNLGGKRFFSRAEAFKEIHEALIKKDFNKVIEIAKANPDDKQTIIFQGLIQNLIKNRNFEEAVTIANDIPNFLEKIIEQVFQFLIENQEFKLTMKVLLAIPNENVGLATTILLSLLPDRFPLSQGILSKIIIEMTRDNSLLSQTQQNQAAELILEHITADQNEEGFEFLARLREKPLPQSEKEGFEIEKPF